MSGLPYKECTNASGGCFTAKACLFDCRLEKRDEKMSEALERVSRERDEHARWRQDLADKLDEVERHRDAIGVALNKLEGQFRLLIAACNRLSAEAEEYDFDDGMGRGALQSYWDEFEDALERARDVIGGNE